MAEGVIPDAAADAGSGGEGSIIQIGPQPLGGAGGDAGDSDATGGAGGETATGGDGGTAADPNCATRELALGGECAACDEYPTGDACPIVCCFSLACVRACEHCRLGSGDGCN